MMTSSTRITMKEHAELAAGGVYLTSRQKKASLAAADEKNEDVQLIPTPRELHERVKKRPAA